MISVQLIYERLNDLSSQYHTGYLDADEFNRNINAAQEVLFQFYYRKFEEDRIVAQSLVPFLKEEIMTLEDSRIIFPYEFRYEVDFSYLTYTNPECGSTSEPRHIPFNSIGIGNESEARSSHLRRPSLDTGYLAYTRGDGFLKTIGVTSGSIFLKYFINPPEASRGSTIDVVNQLDAYDPLSTIDLLWNDQDIENFVDLMLVYKGIETRNTELLSWVKEKNIISSSQ